MPKRKYARGKEVVQGYECCNKKCKWQGLDHDKVEKGTSGRTALVCPGCGKDEFYGLLEFKKVENEKL